MEPTSTTAVITIPTCVFITGLEDSVIPTEGGSTLTCGIAHLASMTLGIITAITIALNRAKQAVEINT